jgi:hypothetical protein
MKRILVCDRGDLKEWYGQAAADGGQLRLRWLEQAGRLELVQVTNDPPPYWFVLIRNFDQSPIGKDRQALAGLTSASGNGVWRFQDFAKARTQFELFKALPIFVEEAKKAQKHREEKKERLARLGISFPKKSDPFLAATLS